MADEITYQQPIGVITQNVAGTTTLRVVDFTIHDGGPQDRYIEVVLGGDNGVRRTGRWDSVENNERFMQVFQALNSGSFAPKRLRRWLLEQALADGFCEPGGTAS